ncbi:IS110 family transposase [Photobacterium toruni]|nr:IS110 family transposase [Photobacterium toruni]
MMLIKVLGIDLGKTSFHLIGHDHAGREVYRKKCNRAQLLKILLQLDKTTVAMESCAGSHWLARKCQSFGHNTKLIPPQYVKPYVKTNKNDYIDADAIAEASTRPSMRFVSVKTEESQILSAVQRIRSGFIKEQTATMCRIGALLLEFGITFPRGHAAMGKLFQWLADKNHTLPPLLLQELAVLYEHYQYLHQKIAEQDKKIKAVLKESEMGELLQTIPGIGPMIASACLSEVPSPKDFKNGRHLAAWMGLVPRQYSTGGKSTLLGISKRGNKSLRTLFIHGARALISRPKIAEAIFGDWIPELLKRKPFNVAVVALANKLARIAWSVMVTGLPFRKMN